MTSITEEELGKLLAKTQALANTIYCVEENFGLKPKVNHKGICINHQDLMPMSNEFVEELLNTITNYVYSQHNINKMIAALTNGRTPHAVANKMRSKAKDKFRPYSVNGQFSELLLYNLLQHYFKAVPLLRKMQLTTNPQHERNGADAIHIAKHKEKFLLFIGEAKTHTTTTNNLSYHLKEGIKSLITHYNNHFQELNLYVYEDFIPPELEQVAEDYKSGKDTNYEVHLVCLVAYEIGKNMDGMNREEVLNKFIVEIKAETQKIGEQFFDTSIPTALLPRLNYILFPVYKFEEVIDEFKKSLGV